MNTVDRQCESRQPHGAHAWFTIHTPLDDQYYCRGAGVIATCVEHGDQEFVRCEACMWWYCPEDQCKSVIPDENVTPDGADVIVWWASIGHCGAVSS